MPEGRKCEILAVSKQYTLLARNLVVKEIERYKKALFQTLNISVRFEDI